MDQSMTGTTQGLDGSWRAPRTFTMHFEDTNERHGLFSVGDFQPINRL